MESLRKNAKWYFFCALFVANIFIWYVIFSETRNGILAVVFLDVGQGDAIFIEAPNGNQILIDGGPNKAVLAQLSGIMPFYDRSIDALILTHPHLDHLGGLVEVMKRYDIDFIFESGNESATAEFSEWRGLIEEKKIKVIDVLRGMRVNIDKNIYFDIMLPDVFEKSSDPHKNMVVGRLTYGDICFLFTGDMERTLEFKILNDDIDCEILKVGHHGSKTSSSEAFLQAVSPDVAVIQLGTKNRYGHPHPAVLERLLSSAARVFRTDIDGAVILKSDGRKIFVK